MTIEDAEPLGQGVPVGHDEAAGVTGACTLSSLGELRTAVNDCQRCALWKTASRAVPGAGLASSRLMLVGEAPGNSEDLQGRPFVGSAGAILDRALKDAGPGRETVYITNAVKHFKFEPRGNRRLHLKPSAGEIEACHEWLAQELRLVSPKLVMALGGTAAGALRGHPVIVSQWRGVLTRLTATAHLWVTIHPSSLLRVPEEARRRNEYARFVHELKDAMRWIAAH
jgi:DNA polymerase